MIFLVKGVINSVIFNTNMLHSTLNMDKGLKMFRKAFTLAEILITLGVIGIVAAITIPQIVSNYKKHVIETKLKKTYSLLLNTVRMSESENGNLQYPARELWDKNNYFSGPEFIDTYFLPYLNNVVKHYTGLISPQMKNGAPSYYKTIIFTDNSRIAYRAQLFQWPWNKQAPLLLGNFCVLYGDDNDEIVAGKNYFCFKFGYSQMGEGKSDVMFIYTSGDYGKDPNVSMYCSDNIIKTSCANGDTLSCTKMIYCNNWKIPDDYPIKF